VSCQAAWIMSDRMPVPMPTGETFTRSRRIFMNSLTLENTSLLLRGFSDKSV